MKKIIATIIRAIITPIFQLLITNSNKLVCGVAPAIFYNAMRRKAPAKASKIIDKTLSYRYLRSKKGRNRYNYLFIKDRDGERKIDLGRYFHNEIHEATSLGQLFHAPDNNTSW